MPLNGDIAGLMARTSEEQFPWFSPAGSQRGNILNAVKLAYNPNKVQRDTLYVKRINPVIFSPGAAPFRHSFTHLPPVLPHHLKTCWWRKTLQNFSFCFTSTSPLETVNSPSSIIYAFTCQYLGWNTIKYFLGWHNLQHHLQVQKSFVLTVAFQHFCKKCHYLR